MKTYTHLFETLISLGNLEDAYWKARRGKWKNQGILDFHKHWRLHLLILREELKGKTYHPRPLKTFVLRDPKTRTISVSDFRDRVVHHALVNVLQPIYEPRFIHDSYASRKGKGALAAIKRLDGFLRKVTRNGARVATGGDANAVRAFALKADIRHFFDAVDHETLMSIISRRIRDCDVLWLVRTILCNHDSGAEGKGMPLGNWTSQFFANVYLNELDQLVKCKLKVRFYMRYVDDFVILNRSKTMLETYREEIEGFLRALGLQLHPEKSNIIPLVKGVHFLGYHIFYFHKHLLRRNIRKIRSKLEDALTLYREGHEDSKHIFDIVQGWEAYAKHADTFKLRMAIQEEVEHMLRKSVMF